MPYVYPNNQDIGTVHDGSRICKLCGERKSMELFHWVNRRRSKSRVCKPCYHARQQRKRELIPIEVRRAKDRAGALKRKYGLAKADYLQQWHRQNGDCGICGEQMTETGVNKKVQVDHDHRDGRVRGLLCFTCNTGLGKFRDSEDLLQRAIRYLQNHQRGLNDPDRYSDC